MCPEATLILLDNGSLEAAATLSLRRLAAGVSRLAGRPVLPVSLLHSHKVPAEKLEGEAAVILEPFLKRQLAEGRCRFRVLPLFFGPSGALTEYLPARLEVLRKTWPSLELELAPFVADLRCEDGWGLAELLAENALGAAAAARHPHLILVDHGSPRREVTAVRNHLADTLRARLGGAFASVAAASMERRPEAEYDFNEPLLERALAGLPAGAREALVLPLFVSPGRHAGPGGDIAGICAAAQAARPGLVISMAGLVGEHPRLPELLARGLPRS